jgi:hypothetical protein
MHLKCNSLYMWIYKKMFSKLYNIESWKMNNRTFRKAKILVNIYKFFCCLHTREVHKFVGKVKGLRCCQDVIYEQTLVIRKFQCNILSHF